MKLKIENYYPLGSALLFFNLLISSILFGQHTSLCPIGVGTEPKPQRTTVVPNHSRQITSPYFTAWQNVQASHLNDDKYASIALAGNKFSRVIRLRDFRVNIPQGSRIQGITVNLYGQSDKALNIDEVGIFLTGPGGSKKGINRANSAWLQKPWMPKNSTEDGKWCYGGPTDVWGAIWNAADVNHSDFGLEIQIRNMFSDPVMVMLNHAEIIIDYVPPYSFCDGKCLTFHIDKFEQAGSYIWHVPDGFDVVSKSVFDQTIDLNIDGAPYGLYEICVDIFSKTGIFSERCCRPFLYTSCNTAGISGQVWMDLNNNGIRDITDDVLAGIPITLYNGNHDLLDTKISDIAGEYAFQSLPDGQYFVKAPIISDKIFIVKSTNSPAVHSEISNNNGIGSTDIFPIEQNQLLKGIDIGYTPMIAVGDFVWEDKNYNGLQDTFESGIQGTLVRVFNSSGQEVMSTVTNAEGRYRFDSLPANKYVLKFQNQQHYVPTFKKPGSPGLRSIINADGYTDTIAFAQSGFFEDVDAGFYRKASVGNYVWEDLNGNGIQDMGEPGVSGLEVILEGFAGDGSTVQLITYTDSDGQYIFENLNPGNYTIRVGLPSGYRVSIYKAGDDTAIDNDAEFRERRDAFEAFVSTFTLMSGEINLTIDIGLYRLSEIGEMVWEDINGNGIFEDGEPGIAGVEIYLTGILGDGSEIEASTVTNSEGKYSFSALKPGIYTLQLTLPDGYSLVNPFAGSDVDIDSDFDPVQKNLEVSIISNTQRNDIDAGLYRATLVSGMVWEDLDCNSIKTSDEPSLDGVMVTLEGVSGQGLDVNLHFITTLEGNYSFSGLVPGNYTLTIVGPVGYETLQPLIYNLTVQSGVQITIPDIPFYKRGSITDIVWHDINKNGIRDSGEPGLSGLIVQLYGIAAGNPVTQSVSTDADGNYLFNELKPGVYYLSFQIPIGFLPTQKNVGTDSAIDSDIDEIGNIADIMLISGQQISGLSAGFVLDAVDVKGSIGDFVWEDKNGNGLQDIGERGLTNIEIILTGSTASGEDVSLVTYTDENGFYLFDNLDAGEYMLKLILPVVYVFTQNSFTDTEKNSDFNPITGQTEVIILGSGENRLDIDAGLFSYAIIGDRVWLDVNENGIFDHDEPGIPGVALTLRRTVDGSVAASVVTGNFGFYAFGNVVPGNYFIRAEIPEGYRITSAFEGDSDIDSDFFESNGIIRTNDFFVYSNDFIINLDLGLIQNATGQGGYVWMDENNDGIRDEEEPGVSGIKVVLLTSDKNEVDSTFTDEAGFYIFNTFESGQYFIRFSIPEEFNFTLPLQSAGTDVDSDVIDFETGETVLFDVLPGLINENIGAGYVIKSVIGDFVWVDSNENGFQDTDENGLNNVGIKLYSAQGVLRATTFSGLNPLNGKSGYYQFSDLMYGNYYLEFELPENLDYTISIESNSDVNSDVDGSNGPGTTKEFTVLPGQQRLDIDAGFVISVPLTGNISGKVWQDKNNNLIRDLDEPVLSGVDVRIFTGNGVLVSSMMSDADGSYSFADLEFGDYYLKVGELIGKVFVLKDGNNPLRDSDITNDFGQGTTSLLTLFPGQSLENIDFGFADKISIGNFVWDDLNYNGLQDPDEPGLQNIEIRLFNAFGNLVSTKFSDTEGIYLFDSIAEGIYSLRFSIPGDYLITLMNPTSNELNSKADFSGIIGPINFIAGGDYSVMDVGFVRSATIGDAVWLDLNGNGIQNVNEPGITGIPVHLFTPEGILVKSVNTEVQAGSGFAGYYNITGVRPGSYYVRFDIPSNYVLSPDSIGDVDIDSDITGANGPGTTDIFTVGPGEYKNTVDAGAYLPATLGDFVWEDLNENGIQDPGEPGIADVNVDLFASTGQLIASTKTDENGFYSFINLRQRLYYLQFQLIPGFRFTHQNAGDDNAVDSDVDATGTTPLISLAHGATFLGVDAGMFLTNNNMVLGRIWMDENQNGIREPDEKLIDSVSVYLVDENIMVYYSATTNHAGMYCLTSDMKGDFFVRVLPIESHIFTEYKAGEDPRVDNDVFDDGISDMVSFEDEPSIHYIDGGMYYKAFAELRGIVWEDKNNNGIMDDEDTGIANVPVLIFNKARIFVKSAKTEIDGSFSINGLEGGEYYCLVPSFEGKEFILFNSSSSVNFSNITNQFGLGTTRLVNLTEGFVTEDFNIGYRVSADANRVAVLEKISEEANSQEQQIFPNPAFWYIDLPVKSIGQYDYSIFNINGQMLQSGSGSENVQRLKIEHLPAGRYFVHIRSGNKDVVKSFIKLDY